MIQTGRLILRWPEPRDRAPLHAMWADAAAMRDLGPVKDAAASDAALARHAGYHAQRLGFWAVERRADGATIGFCGLKPGAADTPIAGAIEAGWMITRAAWRQGYALEAMAASLAWGWREHSPDRIVAITAARNGASRALMTRLGMAHAPAMDFDHPQFAPGDPLRPSVVYAIDRPRGG